ncbi:isocitrate lyase/PEP mutase family protein [Sphingobacterium faecale]|uniref:Isocitrate lyase/phosphoenolpyruvate mutase family protein n=1 Tax=Sphingobacterium faecale TaxID=2803775 RepID=A0ABS1R327_9SPHI|nr:isocitrate lyase/phosphoenolpyruvate mutase family protein [Sphingobacterium faecale]MBL1408624.1 isocitrate lyase/phosphoenolpyruvate mutase family protein [Sphingobacterium faecale]
MSYTKFKKLHQQEELLVLGNVWDAQSALLAEESGFQALGTSSHAIANLLGYPDGEKISVDEILFMIERIVKAVDIPVSVDFEAGYADDPQQVATNVGRLVDLGVVGINIEDGKVIKEGRQLQSADLLQQKIQAIKACHRNIFINARIDTYTTKHANALEESIKRASMYQDAGADGLFVPLAEKKSDIESLLQCCSLPINLFLTSKLPSIAELSRMGIKRLSHGAKIYEQIVQENKNMFEKFIANPALST